MQFETNYIINFIKSFFLFSIFTLSFSHCKSTKKVDPKILKSINDSIVVLIHNNEKFINHKIYVDNDTLKCEFIHKNDYDLIGEYCKLVFSYLINKTPLIRQNFKYVKMTMVYPRDTHPKDTPSINIKMDSLMYGKNDSYFKTYPAISNFTLYLLKNVSSDEMLNYDLLSGNCYHGKVGVYSDFSFCHVLEQYAIYCKTGQDPIHSVDILLNIYNGLYAHSVEYPGKNEMPDLIHMRYFIEYGIPKWKLESNSAINKIIVKPHKWPYTIKG